MTMPSRTRDCRGMEYVARFRLERTEETTTGEKNHECCRICCKPALVGSGRLERVLRSFHQRPVECHCAHHVVPVRGAASARHGLRARAAGAGHRAADRQPVLCVACLQAREGNRSLRCHSDAIWPKRTAHVHRGIRGHVAHVPHHQGSDDRLCRGPGLVLHHRRHRAAGLFRRAVDPQDDPARRDAGHACRHFHCLHLDAPGVPDVGSSLDRLRLLRHRSHRLDREYPPSRRHSGRHSRR